MRRFERSILRSANPVLKLATLVLTSQLSKVVERAVGGTFVPWFGEHAFGENQYAYSAGKSHRDVLAINVCSWLLLMEGGQAAGLYCSDVSGAFDRVSCERLCAKLRASGLPDCAVSLLESWLEDRISIVVVAGAQSLETALRNSVFQGTVLGPPLWNVYYADAKDAVRKFNFTETVFADNFNCWTSFDKDAKEFDVVLQLSLCQHHLHAWDVQTRSSSTRKERVRLDSTFPRIVSGF